MLKKIVALGLVGLFLAMSLVVAQDNIGSYDRAADVNGDGIVDILDLTQVGQAYGSNYTLGSEVNKTVVTVVSFVKEPPEIQDALVVINPGEYASAAITNSSGVAVFDLLANSSYTAYAWSGGACNNVGFSTNSWGEASVLITLGEPLMPMIRNTPQGKVLLTFRNNVTSAFYLQNQMFWLQIYRWDPRVDGSTWSVDSDDVMWFGPVYSPACAIGPVGLGQRLAPNRAYVFICWLDMGGNTMVGTGAFQIGDECRADATIFGNFSSVVG